MTQPNHKRTAITKQGTIEYNRPQSFVAILLSRSMLTKLYKRIKNRVSVHNSNYPNRKKAMPTLNLFLEWARGTGKSTILALYIKYCSQHLPRGIGVLVGSSYVQILTRTLPATIMGLELQGLIKDVHFFVGRRAPKSWKWPEAYQPPLDYKHAIHFYTGYTILMVSQDRPGDGRGINCDHTMGDEAALLDFETLQTDVWATNRGSHRRAFQNEPLHRSNLYMSSTPLTQNGQWFINMEENAQRDDLTYFLRARARDNQFLPETWFESMASMMEDWVYDAEIENIRLKTIKDGFYPSFSSDRHTYTDGFNYSYYDDQVYETLKVNCLGDGDLDPTAPLIAGIDWGAKINCMAIGQRHLNEFRFLKGMHVNKPKILDDLANEFADYYAAHFNKTIYLHYDASGNNSQANSRFTYAEQFKKILEARGWIVILHTRGNTNPEHDKKYRLWNELLREEKGLPIIRFNAHNCKYLIISIERAPAKKGRTDVIQKDKASETSKKIPAKEATHYSDAADNVIYGLYADYVSGGSAFVPDEINTY